MINNSLVIIKESIGIETSINVSYVLNLLYPNYNSDEIYEIDTYLEWLQEIQLRRELLKG